MLGLVAGGVIGWWFIGLLRCLLCCCFGVVGFGILDLLSGADLVGVGG